MADDGGWRQSDEEAGSVTSDDQPSIEESTDDDLEGPTDSIGETIPDPMINGDGQEDGAVAGSFAPDLDVRPQSPRLEHVIFVALGVYIAILAVGRMFAGGSVYDPQTLAAITFAVFAGAALLYGFFVRTNPDT